MIINNIIILLIDISWSKRLIFHIMIYYSDETTRLKTVMFTKLIDGHKFQSNPSILVQTSKDSNFGWCVFYKEWKTKNQYYWKKYKNHRNCTRTMWSLHIHVVWVCLVCSIFIETEGRCSLKFWILKFKSL